MSTYQDFYKECDKVLLYNDYFKLVKNPKNYNSISKQKMGEEIHSLYLENIPSIFETCSLEEIEVIEKLLDNQKLTNEERVIASHLIGAFITYLDFNSNKYRIVEPLKEAIKQHISEVDKARTKDKDNINQRVIALMKIYGSIDTGALADFYMLYYKGFESRQGCMNYLQKNLYLKRFYKIVRGNGFYQAIYWNYYNYEEEARCVIEDACYKTPSQEEIDKMVGNHFDFDRELVDKVYDFVSKYQISSYPTSTFLQLVKKCADTVTSYQKMEQFLKEENISGKKLEQAMADIKEVIINIPSMKLLGHTIQEMVEKEKLQRPNKLLEEQKEKLKENKKVQQYQKVRKESIDALTTIDGYVKKNKELVRSVLNAISINKVDGEDSCLFSYIVTFCHTEEEDESLFDHFFRDCIDSSNQYYSIFQDMRTFRRQSIFKINKINQEEGTIDLIDVKDKKKYRIIDIAMSSTRMDEIDDLFIYTTLWKIDDIYFTVGYTLLLQGKENEVLENMEKEKKRVKFVKNEEFKELIVAMKMYKKSNLKITNLEVV